MEADCWFCANDLLSLLNASFDDKLISNAFPVSEHIIWEFFETGFSAENHSNELTIYTSLNWIDELKGIKNYKSTAYSDGQLH